MANTEGLPMLPTMGVGSYAAPGWFVAAYKMARAGEMGPHDVTELLDDATQVVIDDQRRAGVDIFSDGELRRQRFVFEMYGLLDGLERVPPRRRLGITGYDMVPRFIDQGSVSAPDGLRTVDEFRALSERVPDKPLKIAIPGPLTFAGSIDLAKRSADSLLEDLIVIVREELQAVVGAGADYIQLDEPGLTDLPYGLTPEQGAAIINRAIEGIEARTAVHVCFGNNAGRPMADRRMHPLMPALESLETDQLILEFANREFAELDLLGGLAERFDLAIGVIDVKNFFVEPAELVAERIAAVLHYVPASRLTVTADCGFSALPRYIAFRKLCAMTEGAALARAAL